MLHGVPHGLNVHLSISQSTGGPTLVVPNTLFAQLSDQRWQEIIQRLADFCAESGGCKPGQVWTLKSNPDTLQALGVCSRDEVNQWLQEVAGE